MKRSFSIFLLLGLFISCSSGKTKVIHVKPVLCQRFPCTTNVIAGVLEHPEGVDNPLNWYLLQKDKDKISGIGNNHLSQLEFSKLSLLPVVNTDKLISLQKNQNLYINYSPSRIERTSSKLKRILSVKRQGNNNQNGFIRATVKRINPVSRSACNANLPSSQQYLLTFYFKFGSESQIPKQERWEDLKNIGYQKYEFPFLEAEKPYFLLNKFPKTNQKIWLVFFRCLFPLALDQGRDNALTFLRYKGIDAFFAGNRISIDSSYFLYFILPEQKIIYKIQAVHPARLLFFLYKKEHISFPQMYRIWEEMLQAGVSPSWFSRRKEKLINFKIEKNSRFFSKP
ncbi:MAG: hypothetical protein ACQES9_11175 [Myxococcota bacterium]